MKNDCFVGIDTSNYTTSVALCTAEGEVIANLKAPLPVAAGERGLRQSDAVFAHVKNLPELTERLRPFLVDRTVRAVGVSSRPRQAEDSYMPCFLSGVATAEAFGAALGVPVYRFAHQDGHVMAAVYSAGVADRILHRPFGAFHVSGGTTEVLYAEPSETGFSITLIGKTNDLNAGQVIDRCGVMMGLRFPCGPEMERLARSHGIREKGIRTCVREGNCNLSGLQNLCETMYRETEDSGAVSAFLFAFLGKTLREMTQALDEKYPAIPIVYAGGVMSNGYLQSVLSKRENTYFARPEFSSDNAAGIALLCRKRMMQNASGAITNECR